MSTVVIIGRKNTGKSMIFNRLTGLRQSVVYKEPGVTRDRIYGEVEWCGRSFNIIDTGGFFPDEDKELALKIHQQIFTGLAEADLIYFVVDGIQGLHPSDEDIAHHIRKTNKPSFLLVNKIDSKKARLSQHEFTKLGMPELFNISAEAGTGFGDLLDRTIEILPEAESHPLTKAVQLLILGRPNAGKSTLLNVLTRTERAIVDQKPGTTRDCVNAQFMHKNTLFEVVDTAGLRRPARVKKSIEFYSVLRAIQRIEHADIVMILFDTALGVVDQDKRIASLVLSKAKGLIFVPTKIDLIPRKQWSRIELSTRTSFKGFEFVPAVPVSAQKNIAIERLMNVIIDVNREMKHRLHNDVLQAVTQKLHPPSNGTIMNLRQIGIQPPVFRITLTSSVNKSYIQYIRNTIRQFSSFPGVPILIRTQVKKRRMSRHVQ